ncbi:hypothetical protein BD410DRAFT_791947 [Rickenella mellea]|uniref:DUF1275 domain protein n=1 Tax=Rickenella mellea TaxID=50990 RepID=A0A4Y7PX13_9AGAM|nr:hypothetical protein BD410DRAFT_791947 [Rickenella mellea]
MPSNDTSELDSSAPTLPTATTDFPPKQPSRMSTSTIKKYLLADVDPALSTPPLAAYCFMTGFIDAISFSAVFVWCGFQTGNTVQLSLALARLFSPGNRDSSFHIADRQALCSLLSFISGAFIGRLGDKIGAKTRAWLSLGTFIQALLSMAAAIAAWKGGQGSIADNRGDPAWTNALGFVALGFASASVGLQGIMGKRVNTQFTTTVVLTTVWCELMADPQLFTRGYLISRDHKLLAIFSLFLGGFVGRALLDQVGSAGAFGIGTGFRVLIAISWLWVPAKVQERSKSSKKQLG